MKFLVENSKRSWNFQINGHDKIVEFACHNCEMRNITEKLRYDSEIGLIHRSPHGSIEQEYTRIIFGIHPGIIKKHNHVPVKQSSLYFCSHCESSHSIYDNLLSVAKEVAGCEFDEGLGVPELVSEKGTWITANRFGKKKANFNLQISLDIMNKIFKRLIERFPTNPFRIIDLER